MDWLKNIFKFGLILVVFLTMGIHASQAEGTPSFWKNYGGLALADESGGYALTFIANPPLGLYPGSTYNSDSLNRVYIHVFDHTTETINLGFSVRRISMLNCDNYPNEVFVDYTAANLPANHRVHWRLKDPNGNVVDSSGTTGIPLWNGGATASTTTGFIGSYAEAVAGPDGVSGVVTAGYTPDTYNPTTNGDFYLEFNYGDVDTVFDPTGCTSALVEFAYMDMTVSDGSNNAVDGRVWSRLWPLSTHNRAPNQGITINSSKFHIYTDDSIITKIDFDTISPGNWNVFANEQGVGSSGTFELDSRSDASPATALQRKNRVFLNTPDTNIYPTRPLARTVSPVYVLKCADGDQCIMVDLNRPSDINVYIEINDSAGYQDNSSDVLISNVSGTRGLNCVSWDGLDGLGNPLNNGDTIFIQVLFESDVTQLPLQDLESNPNGLKIELELPVSGRTAAYWNDTLVGGGLDLTGCISNASFGCHTWTGDFSTGIGNGNIINTYWYSTLDTLVPIVYNDSTFDVEFVQDTVDAACANRDTVSAGTINITAFFGPPATDFRWTTTGTGTFTPHDSTLLARYVPSADELLYGGTIQLFLGAREGCPDVRDSITIDFGRRPGGVDYFIATWLKANVGALNSSATAATNGQAVDSWFDYSNQGVDANAVVTGPIFTENLVNNNPSLLFSDDDNERLTATITLNGDETTFATLSQSTIGGNDYLGDASNANRRRLYGGGTNPRQRFEGATTINGASNIALDETFISTMMIGNSSNERIWTNGTSAYDQEFGIIGATTTMIFGNRSNLGSELAGTISEVIIYDSLLPTRYRYQVESYLAIKYGVTLSHNYKDADGSLLFNADGPGGTDAYDYDIAGIGQNLCRMSLTQPKSMSQNNDRVVQMGDPSSLDDFDYLIWGNNDTNLSVIDSIDVPNYYVEERLGRIWNVDTTGDIGTVTVAFYLGNIPNSTTDLNRYALIIGSTPTMANSWTTNYTRAIANDTLYFYEVQFADDDYFTLGVDLVDTDNDSIPDIYDIDDDDDGIPDTLEITSGTDPTNDTDRDGIPDYADSDFPGCGVVTTGVCSNFDTDNDSIPDHLDLDADNDGIPDIVEAGGVDTDGDGRVDIKSDSDDDGLNDPYDPTTGGDAITNPDTDGDGVRDVVDLDADDDGIPDVVEAGGTDIDGDGIADNYVDTDNDGLNDVVDGDVGNDGTAENSADALQLTGTDTNNDGVPDSFPDDDTDGDGVRDQLDLDADNDGIPDVVEAGGTDEDGDGIADNKSDTDGDGFNDVVDGDVGNDGTSENTSDALQVTGADTDNDGEPNSYPEDDTDGDGIRDQLDLDADNDGIPDVVEAGGTDTDGDGIFDDQTDTDGDGFADDVDGDVGNDGTSENTADALQITGADTNNDGEPNSYPEDDTDGDGVRDQLDLDADNDGIPDVVEAGGTDTDGDGIFDDQTDTDNDGLADDVDGDVGNDGTAENTADALQVTGADTNNDGQPNSYPEDDTDGDGIRDQLDLDSDNDGIPDVVEAGGTDTDGDGIFDDQTDTDNDGFADDVDGDVGNDGTAENTADALQITGADTNNDGAPNSYPEDDTDNDGVRDQLDLDADNDGIPDVVEVGGTDENGDGRADDYVDTDSDGFNDVVDGDVGNDGTAENTADALQITGADANNNGEPDSYPVDDPDGDGIRNQLDLDADNDGIADVVEAGGTDVNGDGRADDYADTDGDGYNDVVDGDPNNSLAAGDDSNDTNTGDALTLTGSDTDGDGEPNSLPNDDIDADGVLSYLDLDSDDDGILDVIEVGGADTNRDGLEDAFVDVDNDGFNDNVDGDPNNSLAAGDDSVDSNLGGVTIATGDDTNGDGAPNSFPNGDFDADGLYNHIDIDADNDGIVDNTEGQTTSSYVAPSGTDSDGDGIDNAYDSDDANFSGALSSFELSDIDSTANPNTPDFLDLDSDDDGESDAIEGHDTDGDGVADAGSPSNTGVSGGSTDADGDGLLDGWDNNTSSTDPTNGTLTPTSHPDYDGGDTERDWREIPCDGGTVVLSPINATTVAPDFCRQDPWTYYYDPANPNDILFAIEHKPAGGNTNEFTATVSLTVSSDPDTEAGVYSSEDIPNKDATFVMGRYWNVALTSGTLNGNVNVRFYYETDDADTMQAVALRWRDQHATNPDLTSGQRWFTMTSGTFAPTNPDLTAAGIDGASELTPATTSTQDGVTFVQFDGLSSLTGGGLAFTVGEPSVILPVELLSFTAQAQGDHVLIKWVTASEINSDFFIVQRSKKGESWDDIGMISAAGFSQKLLEYNHVDEQPYKGRSFYRLKQVDRDQKSDLSQIEQVYFGLDESQPGIVLYPNPNNGTFELKMPDNHSFQTVIIRDAMGRIVYSHRLEEGNANIDIDHIESGVYICTLTGASSINISFTVVD